MWNIIDGYYNLMEKRDPRTDGWLLMNSFLPTLFMCTAYVYFVKSLGPKMMKDRAAYQLKSLIIVYNAVQVIASGWIVYKCLKHGWLFRYSYTCQPIGNADDPDEMIMAQVCWWYYFCKFTEFLDTIFFVLRKKNDQITSLHVIHHTIMPISCWWGIKFAPGGQGSFFGLINSAIHVVMYTYYLLAAMGPKYQKYLWWKKHITAMQMAQFALVFYHSAQGLYYDCDYPKVFLCIFCFHSLMFFCLFSNFYVQAYIKRRRLPNSSGTCDVKNYFTSDGIKMNNENQSKHKVN